MASANASRDGHAGSDLSQFHDEFTDIKHSLSHGDAKVCAAGAAKLCALCSDHASASAWLEFLATQRALGTCLDLLGRRLASAPGCAEALLRLSLGCLCVPSTVDALDHAACRGITAGLIGLGCTSTIRTFEVESSAGQGATGSLSPVRPAGTTLASRIRRRGARLTSSAAETGKSTQVPYSHAHVPARTVGNAARSSFAAHGVALPEQPGTGMPLHTSSAWPGLAMLAALCRDLEHCTAQDILVCLLWQALCVESGHEHAAAEAMRLRWRPSTLAGSSTTGVPDSPSAIDGQQGTDTTASQASASITGAVSRSIRGQRRCRVLRAAVAQLRVERLLLHYAQEHLLCCVDGTSDTARARSARVLPVLLAMLDSAVFEQHDAQSALLAASCTRDATWSVDAHSGKASVLPGATAAPVSALQVACAAALHAWQAPAHSPFHRAGVASDVQFCALKLMTSLCHNAASASRQLREQKALWWTASEQPTTHGTPPPHPLTLAVATTLLALQHLQSVVGAVTSSAQAASEHPQFDTALCCCGLLTNALEHDGQLASTLGSAGVHDACTQLCRVLPRDPTSLVAGLAAKPSCVSALAREFGTLYGHVGLPIQAIRSAPSSTTSSLATLPDMPSHGLDEPGDAADDTVRPDVLILLGYLAVLLCHVVVRDAGPRDAVVRGIALRMPHALIQHSTCDTARVEIAALLTALKAFVNVQATLGVLRSAEAQALLMLKQDVELACLASTQRNGHAAPRDDTAWGVPAVRTGPASVPNMPRAFNSLKRRRFGGSAPLDAGAVPSSSPAPTKSSRHSVVLDGAALARAAVKPAPVPAQRVTNVDSAAPSTAGLHRARVGYGNRRR